MQTQQTYQKKYVEKSNRHIVDVLFVLALFGVFAASSLMLVTIGASVYKQTVAHMDESYQERTAYAYITEKIHQHNTNDTITVEELENTPALTFTQEISGVEYRTYLYYHEGYLKELSLRTDSYAGSNLLSAGQEIVPLTAFRIESVQDDLVKLRIHTEDGSSFMIYSSLCNN